MRKSNRPIKTTRLFQLSLADHDQLFAPKQRRRLNYRWLKLLLYVPAAVLILVPSFKLGRGVLRNPGYAIPDTVKEGDVFTIPASEDEDIVPQIGGHALAYIDGKNPAYLGAAFGSSDFEISFQFNDEDKPRIKMLMEKLKHPTYPIWVKHVKVTKQEAVPEILAPPPPPPKKGEEPLRAPPAIEEKEAKALSRHDGYVRMRCWKEPSVEALGIDPLKPRRHQHLGILQAVGQGEVIYTGSTGNGESVVDVYHGGGVFTRYWGIKETRVQKGAKVTTGQTIGYVPLAQPRKQTPATWQSLMNLTGSPKPVNSRSLVDLSSRLCDSK